MVRLMTPRCSVSAGVSDTAAAGGEHPVPPSASGLEAISAGISNSAPPAHEHAGRLMCCPSRAEVFGKGNGGHGGCGVLLFGSCGASCLCLFLNLTVSVL